MQLNIYIVLLSKYLLYVLAFVVSSSGRHLITSQNHLLIVILLQRLSYRTLNISCVVFFLQNLLTVIETILPRSCGLNTVCSYKFRGSAVIMWTVSKRIRD